MKRLISLAIIGFVFIGCSSTKNEAVPQIQPQQKNIFKSKILAKISTVPVSTYTLPYVQKSKYIKILILPFANSDGDVDHGGILETKLHDSKFIFDDNLKKKIIKENKFIGTL